MYVKSILFTITSMTVPGLLLVKHKIDHMRLYHSLHYNSAESRNVWSIRSRIAFDVARHHAAISEGVGVGRKEGRKHEKNVIGFYGEIKIGEVDWEL